MDVDGREKNTFRSIPVLLGNRKTPLHIFHMFWELYKACIFSLKVSSAGDLIIPVNRNHSAVNSYNQIDLFNFLCVHT